MDEIMKTYWEHLHSQPRFRPKYPTELVVQFVFRNFRRDGSQKVLDLGCGAGRHVVFMARENIDAYGVDLSSEGIEHAKKSLEEQGLSAILKQGSVSEIPFGDEMFDGIICYGVLYYCKIEEIKKAISEIRRVLKAGGKGLVVVRSTEDYRFGKGTEIEKNTFIISEEDENKSAFHENNMSMHFFTDEELKDLFSVFSSVTIDKIIQTHNNGQFCDSNYIVLFEK
mgnify:CR=1 FL=1